MLYKVVFIALCSISLAPASGAPSSQIVGGWLAEKNQFPYQISLRWLTTHVCGGSIISEKYVLTAAHCLEDSLRRPLPPNVFSIVAGTNSLRKGGVTVNVEKIIKHKKYDLLLNDVALLELAESLKFDTSIQPIKIFNEEVPDGSNVIISGWGRTADGGEPSEVLKFNIVTSISQEECKQKISLNYEGIICLAHPPNNGPCQGDSGGPAIYQGKLVGVANFAYRKCADIYPDGYAKVSYFTKWIKRNIFKSRFLTSSGRKPKDE